MRTLGIAIMGAVAGAMCGALLLAANLYHWAPGNLARESLPYFGTAACLGAALGALIAPAVRWRLLGRVPLGRALAWSTVGALGGGVAGLVPAHYATGFGLEVATVVVASIVGVLGAAAMLRARDAAGHGRP